ALVNQNAERVDEHGADDEGHDGDREIPGVPEHDRERRLRAAYRDDEHRGDPARAHELAHLWQRGEDCSMSRDMPRRRAGIPELLRRLRFDVRRVCEVAECGPRLLHFRASQNDLVFEIHDLTSRALAAFGGCGAPWMPAGRAA